MASKKIKIKEVCPTFLSAGGGHGFETKILATFAVLMLEKRSFLNLSSLPIKSLRPQTRELGYQTDDLMVFFGENDSLSEPKILIQIKHQLTIGKGNPIFSQVIKEAWEDYKNNTLFSPEKDFIAIVTGPLSAVDIENTRTILEWARDISSGNEFEMKVASAVSSVKKREKLEAFRHNLEAANDGIPLTPDELLQFLKRFYIISMDLDIRHSMIKSLLHSIIGNSESADCDSIWLKIKEEVEHRSISGTSINIKSFSEEVQSHFREKRTGKRIPSQLVPDQSLLKITMDGYESEVISSFLFGSWDFNSQEDVGRISDLLEHNVIRWSKLIPHFFTNESGPIRCRKGKCEVKDRTGFWKIIGPRISNRNLDLFKSSAIRILSERDPKLDLSPDMRFAGSLYKKEFNHSLALRKGVADTLALMECCSEHLTQCSQSKPETIAAEVVHELLFNANSERWASLSSILPILAEASPQQFLKSIEKFIKNDPKSIIVLYSERTSFGGGNCINAILWALETTAWDEAFFVASILNIAGIMELCGGNSMNNRPINSLIEIFLPWSPQTTVSPARRLRGLNILRKEYPDQLWLLLLELLGHQQITSFGTRKPLWQKSIPCDLKEEVAYGDYTQSIRDIGFLTIEMAKHSFVRLEQLCSHLHELSKETLLEAIPLFGSSAIMEMSEMERLPIWNSLMTLVGKHKRFAEADWALDSESVNLLNDIAVTLQPLLPTNFYKNMFATGCFFIIKDDSIEECKYEERDKICEQGIRKIIELEGFQALLSFVENVANPFKFGFILGALPLSIENASTILPDLLDSDLRHLTLMARGFVRGNFDRLGWEWVEIQQCSNWSVKRKGLFFSELPFSKITWDKVTQFLGSEEGCYWKTVETKLHNEMKNLDFAIEKFIEHGKIGNAIDCLSFQINLKQAFSQELAVKALLALPTSGCKLVDRDISDVLKIISALQQSSEININEMINIEWAFLPIKRHYQEFRPILIEKRLAEDPVFFSDTIKLTYRSDQYPQNDEDSSEQRKLVALQTWDLLKDWRTPPGLTEKGFSKEKFDDWLKIVQIECQATGYMKVAMNCLGHVLVNVPPIENDFPLCRDIVEILNEKDSSDILQGYQNGILDLYSVSINPQSSTEQSISLKYRELADLAEEQCYYRFAIMLKELAKHFKDKAIWVDETFKKEI